MKKIIFIVALISILATGCLIDSTPPTRPVACTTEAKLCPDGSYVGRTGPGCQFRACPTPIQATSTPTSLDINCKLDADCPTSAYTCQAIEGSGTVYPNNTKPPSYTITKGVCKIKLGYKCNLDAECLPGLICHNRLCTNPIGSSCNGADDTSCPNGYKCIQSCGPPIARSGEPPPPWFCELNEIADKPKNCPICLASNTKISTPNGEVNIRDIKIGMPVWSLDSKGKRIVSKVITVSHTPTPKTHKVIHLVLNDKREVWASFNHPTVNGLPIGSLKMGETYNGGQIIKTELILYWDTATYDLLPNSDTGYYWANKILLGSTLGL
ncbi:MAG: Hint domain-containing protein [Patescibacteria group bacterium]|jgi:hypothetical protein